MTRWGREVSPNRSTFVGLILSAGLGLAAGCDSTETEKPSEPVAQKPDPKAKPEPKVKPEPKPQPKPQPEPEPEPVLATVAVSSIYLMDDCPDLDPPPSGEASDTPSKHAVEEKSPSMPAPAEGAMAQPDVMGDVAEGDHESRPRCSQSTMQLTFSGQGDAASKAKIVSVDLYATPDSKLGTLASRVPMVWRDGSYVSWDETIPAKTDLKVSYRLSANPSASGPGGGGTYYVKVVVDIDGKTQEVRSPDFTREAEHDVVT